MQDNLYTQTIWNTFIPAQMYQTHKTDANNISPPLIFVKEAQITFVNVQTGLSSMGIFARVVQKVKCSTIQLDFVKKVVTLTLILLAIQTQRHPTLIAEMEWLTKKRNAIFKSLMKGPALKIACHIAPIKLIK